MSAFRTLTLLSILLCLCVVVFGAYVRLSDAGLGCPDWPGCYGHLGVPEAQHDVAAADAKFPERPVEARKAWKEMIHRYLASTLGLLIVALALMGRFLRAEGLPKKLPWFLVGLVIFQGLLGMWTVTWQLKPLAVTAHLAGGMSTLSLLVWMWLGSGGSERGIEFRGAKEDADAPQRELRSEREAAFSFGAQSAADRARTAPPSFAPRNPITGLRALAGLGLLCVAAQIFLGGWTSTNYAALACPDFPTCHGRWLPDIKVHDVTEAYTLWRGLGINYEHGVLDNRERVTIHFFHRVGALVVTVMLLLLSLVLMRVRNTPFWRGYGVAILALLALQVGIGIFVVKLQLPLALAAAHNAGAAILLLTLVSLNYFAWNEPHKP